MISQSQAEGSAAPVACEERAPRGPTSVAAVDRLGRLLTSLRLSVTDRCNLRCAYCMPEESYRWLPRGDLLRCDEIERLVDLFSDLGTRRIRLTGGEPLLRRDLPELVARLVSRPRVEDLGLTTNGVLLGERAAALKQAGLPRITVSLDTLRPQRYRALTKRDDHRRVLEGLERAQSLGFSNTKLNVVVMRGFNDDELEEFVHFGRKHHIEVRFIEYMDVGGATSWRPEAVFPRTELLARLERAFGGVVPLARTECPTAPAERFGLPDGSTIGVIASTTAPFCGTCDRSRLTADGTWFQCLYAPRGLDLRSPLRDGTCDQTLSNLIRTSWKARADRGAELRLEQSDRQPLASGEELKGNPHLEMHTRGG